MSAITEVFRTVRSTLSEGSLKTYTSIITNVGKQMGKDYSTPEAVIQHYEAILQHFADTKPSIRKTKLACLVVFISKTEGNEAATEAFRKLMMEDKVEAEQEEKKQQLTERQQEGWMEWEEVLQLYTALERETKPLWKKPSLDKAEFHRLQMYVLLSCLVLIPVRRSMDWVDFKLKDYDEEKDNYMVYKKRKPFFVFNSYKTQGTYGKQEVPVPTKLSGIILKWMEKNQNPHLLMNYHQKGNINQTQLTQNLHAFFGKPISTSLLRHIYLSHVHKNTPALQQMEQMAEQMGHSVAQQLEYVKKPEPQPAPLAPEVYQERVQAIRRIRKPKKCPTSL